MSSVRSDRPAHSAYDDDEIEVTPEMIAAGEVVLSQSGDVSAIYRAMRRVRANPSRLPPGMTWDMVRNVVDIVFDFEAGDLSSPELSIELFKIFRKNFIIT